MMSLLMTALAVIQVSADDKKEEKPKPDLWVTEIVVPADFSASSEGQVKVIVENLSEGSEMEGNVAVELVVIDSESGGRSSYSSEIQGMKYGQKREALFSGIKPMPGKVMRFLAILDPAKVVEESNEDNNRKLFQVSLKPADPAPAPEASEEAPEEPTEQPEG